MHITRCLSNEYQISLNSYFPIHAYWTVSIVTHIPNLNFSRSHNRLSVEAVTPRSKMDKPIAGYPQVRLLWYSKDILFILKIIAHESYKNKKNDGWIIRKYTLHVHMQILSWTLRIHLLCVTLYLHPTFLTCLT